MTPRDLICLSAFFCLPKSSFVKEVKVHFAFRINIAISKAESRRTNLSKTGRPKNSSKGQNHMAKNGGKAKQFL